MAVGLVAILFCFGIFWLLRCRKRRSIQYKRRQWLSGVPTRPTPSSSSYHNTDDDTDVSTIDPFADPRPAPNPPMMQQNYAPPPTFGIRGLPMMSASAALHQLTPQREGGIVVPTFTVTSPQYQNQPNNESYSPFTDAHHEIAQNSRASSPSIYPPSTQEDDGLEDVPLGEPISSSPSPPARPPKSMLRSGPQSPLPSMYQPLTPPDSPSVVSDSSMPDSSNNIHQATAQPLHLVKNKTSTDDVIRRKTLLDVSELLLL